MKRVAITGAGGFIGRELARALDQAGAAALPVAREASGPLRAPDGGADVLVHLAFPTSPDARRRDPLSAWDGVMSDSIEVVRVAARIGARRVVVASSGKVYGAGAGAPIGDDDPARPTTQLGRLKLAAEAVVLAGCAAAGVEATILRIFNVYGPGQPAGFFFPALIEGLATGRLLLGELDHGRDWVHVRDVASAIVAAIDAEGAAARVLNVATGRATTVREILGIVRALGRAVPEPEVLAERLREREAPIERADAAGLRALGWAPRTALEQGVAELLDQGSGAR